MTSPPSAADAVDRSEAPRRRSGPGHRDRRVADQAEDVARPSRAISRTGRFVCDRCRAVIAFDARSCPRCRADLGYLSDRRSVSVVTVGVDSVTHRVEGDPRRYWRCLNAAWGCNWMVDAADGAVWCRSCALTRGRPDEGRPAAMEAWMVAEAAKRQVIHQLDLLGLRFEARSPTAPDGLAFDLVYLPDTGAVTGHLGGIVTLDLAEVDDAHRHRLRRQLDERFRTVVGHLRHEIGHYYWNVLVGQSDDLAEFRRLFGDERADYATSIEAHYGARQDDWDAGRHITAYAASHPLEDWAETFAHHLHLLGMLEVAAACGLIDDPNRLGPELALRSVLDMLLPVIDAVNGISEALGSPAVYPFEPAGVVVDKLDFVDRRIAAHAERSRFYATW